ncbi:DUF998 domain-containing protein [Promicromonospora thailandica]|uniref:DUF998 domain-containing protein n=1 Tax=Promicromonospora thailandica TaxID=765201 RepID=A0A9X2G238_9MICO|nr:DUF998 domain-containing protein [Promicromonospora thailandica]MCP2263892.1 Protein of unknown function (DUF998) [Promicromonospora thailandica]BFF17799.1 hypothetical protein GCM10025730_13200 [Promicromonospora thailandica]
MTVEAVDLGRHPDQPVSPADARSTRTVGWFGATALLPMVAAHVVGASVVDPVLDPISWYAFVPGGGELILAGGLVLAVLGLLLTVRMYRAGLAAGPVPAVAMILFAVAMVLVGAFPTDPPDLETPASMSAVIHRVSAAGAFCVLPLVGLSIERTIQQPRSALPQGLRAAARALGTVVALFLVVHLSLVFFADSGIVAFGLIERIGFVIMIAYLFLIAATIDREGLDGAAGTPGAGPTPALSGPRSAGPVV